MQYLFFVTTYGSIYNRVLPLLEQLDADVTIVASTPTIFKFFDECTPYSTLLLPVKPEFFSHHPFETFYALLGIRKFKKRLPSSDMRIYFFGDSWQLSVYSLIKKLSKKNYVHQFITTTDSIEEKQIIGWKQKCASILVKLLLGIDVIVCKENDIEYFKLNPNFYKKNRILQHFDEVKPLGPNNKYTKYFSFNGASILLAVEDVPSYNRISEVEYTSVMNTVCNILKKHTEASTLRVKQHPNQKKTYGTLKELPQIPKYIPSELCLSHPWKVVIGAESYTLLHATRLTHDIPVISLLNLLPYHDDAVRDHFIEWFKQSTSKIHFPKTFEELEELICNVL